MLKNKLSPAAVLWMLGVLVADASFAWGEDAPCQRTRDGIRLRVGDADVELAAVTPGTLRLSISREGKPPALGSTFLAPGLKASAPKWEVVHRDALVGIGTAIGKLLIDPQTGLWCLENTSGNPLIHALKLGKLTSVTLQDKTAATGIALALTAEGGAATEVYGSGDGAPALAQTTVLP